MCVHSLYESALMGVGIIAIFVFCGALLFALSDPEIDLTYDQKKGGPK
jgi:hypothetical protein